MHGEIGRSPCILGTGTTEARGSLTEALTMVGYLMDLSTCPVFELCSVWE